MPQIRQPKIMILTVTHGAAHLRVGRAMREALLDLRPEAEVEVVDALRHCTRWFRAYYNSYVIPLRLWPSFWGWIESIQHQSESTGPGWLYSRGAQPLFRYLRDFAPDVVIATEVGTCELACMFKREERASFILVGATAGVDVDRPWAQPEVDLYPVMPGDPAAQLEMAGVPLAKILPCGVPIDPAFGSLPDRQSVRTRLKLDSNLPVVLVLFGGTGHGRPRRILEQLRKIPKLFQAVFITGRNRRLEEEVRAECQGHAGCRVLGWVDNMHEWLAAADLVLSKPGGMTVTEAINSAVPLLALDPLPGAERRACNLIEKWGVGFLVKHYAELAPTIERLLSNPQELSEMRGKARTLSRPNAARDAAQAVLALYEARSSRIAKP